MAFQVLPDFSAGVIPLVEQSQRSGVSRLDLVVRGQQGYFLLAHSLTHLQPGRHNTRAKPKAYSPSRYTLTRSLLRFYAMMAVTVFPKVTSIRFWYRKIKSRDPAYPGHG